MKAVTIAKIARLIVVIAVAVVLAIPTFAGFESLQINKGEFVATDSIYEATQMTSSDLAGNIKTVTEGKGGYTVSYGSVIGVPVPEDDTKDASTIKSELTDKIKAAIPDKAESFEVTLLNPEGKICKQQIISGSDGMTMYITTGIKLTESMVNMVKIDATLDSVFKSSRNVLSDVDVQRIGDSYKVTVPIPYIMFATALAGGKESRLGLSIDVEYNNFFNATFKMDLPVDKFMRDNEGGSIIDDIKYKLNNDAHVYDGNDDELKSKGVIVRQEISGELPKDVIGLENLNVKIGNFGGAENGVRVEVNADGKVQLMTDNKDGLVEELLSNVNDKGELEVSIDSDNPEVPKTFTIQKEYVDSFISMSGDIVALLEALSS